ncbi:acyl-CoA dehydrogenase [Hyphomicrobium sp. DMF-1]|uniref:acyl-CoA dehydrogenase n=1 Tax=Hyphomicrobium sp. DMF-1 TaxID=3019544 RepID=UPI0022EBB6A0|nr:acyl-CoA dehydrogenase [Hyphomicrobium sp. DMF-1]WBT36537.1 acyl-CoA dehydrogenase [Hyphomicrobium sp. DMF-1]
MALILLLIALIAVALALGMWRASAWQWAVGLGAVTLAWQSGVFHGALHWPSFGLLGFIVWLGLAALASFSIPKVRRQILVQPAFKLVRGILPKVSDTEQQALDAGTVGFDAEIFSGTPDWTKLRAVPPIVLTPEERAFLDGPTEQLCGMIDHWQIRHAERRMPPGIWEFVKANGFLGMLISKEHGGLGFSAQAQSLILGKIASRSPDVVTIVMVPNSLGPGELIEKYGTDEQKHHYLPRLAKGLEVPCFSLTGPTSGSDAATMRDIGYVTKGQHDGREVVGIRLSWDKRYITLGPEATLVGLAFRLFDPDKILGGAEDIGITVALIPATHPGVNIGRRHLPSGAAFPNGPNWGTDVFIPVDWVIGGEKMVGQGWRMLMECLAAGRAISLPSSATAGAKAMLRVTTAYARIRRQFGLPVARMEGVEEPLARLVETAYVNEAARAVTAAMVSRGERPSVISALMKYQTTERLRRAVNDAFDVHGGRAICDGPTNYLQSAYQLVPVGITVEGANILTRTLITFAQGALRSHPYLYKEVRAVQDPDSRKGLDAFEDALLGHISFSISNVTGAFFHNLTLGYFAEVPERPQGLETIYRQLSRASRNFALVADLTVAMLGGGLKVKQKLTGRLADALSEIYLLSCVLKRFEDDGRPEADRPIVAFAAANGLHRFEEALRGTVENFPNPAARVLLRVLVFPFGRHYFPAPDALGSKIVRLALEPGEVRDRLTRDIYISNDPDDVTGLLEVTLKKVVAAEDAEKKLERAIRAGIVRRYHGLDWIEAAAEAGTITESEAQLLREVEALTARVIAVDHFAPEELKPNYVKAPSSNVGHNSRGLTAGANQS